MRATVLVAVLLFASPAFAQELKPLPKNPTVNDCRALANRNPNQWLGETALRKARLHDLVVLSAQLETCTQIDRGGDKEEHDLVQAVYSSWTNLLNVEVLERMKHFLVRHQLMEQLLADDAQGQR
jgi:hypothetical protein